MSRQTTNNVFECKVNDVDLRLVVIFLNKKCSGLGLDLKFGIFLYKTIGGRLRTRSKVEVFY